jgi:hypothetical protein
MDNNHLSPAEELNLGLPPDAEARVIKVCLFLLLVLGCRFDYPVNRLYEQEARKEGVFAGLTGGLASGKCML